MTIIDDLSKEDKSEGAEAALRLLADDSYLSDRVGRALISQRRRSIAESMAVGDIDEMEAIKLLKKREDEFVEWVENEVPKEDLEPVPEWLLRAEAMDLVTEKFLEKLKQEE